MIELYLDTVDVEQVIRFNASMPLKGVTTNPSILAKSGVGLTQVLPVLAEIIGADARFHVQVVSQTVGEMLDEAKRIHDLPYDIVVKVPATELGMAAIRKIKAEGIEVLATAIYSAHQGFLAALSGADYLAPYVNRIETMGVDGIAVVADLQLMLEKYGLASKILAASFKNTMQVTEVMKLGIGAITLPVEVAAQMFAHPAVNSAVAQFNDDWQGVFGSKRAFET